MFILTYSLTVKAEGGFVGMETSTNPFGANVTAPAPDLSKIEKVIAFNAVTYMAPAINIKLQNYTVSP